MASSLIVFNQTQTQSAINTTASTSTSTSSTSSSSSSSSSSSKSSTNDNDSTNNMMNTNTNNSRNLIQSANNINNSNNTTSSSMSKLKLNENLRVQSAGVLSSSSIQSQPTASTTQLMSSQTLRSSSFSNENGAHNNHHNHHHHHHHRHQTSGPIVTIISKSNYTDLGLNSGKNGFSSGAVKSVRNAELDSTNLNGYSSPRVSSSVNLSNHNHNHQLRQSFNGVLSLEKQNDSFTQNYSDGSYNEQSNTINDNDSNNNNNNSNGSSNNPSIFVSTHSLTISKLDPIKNNGDRDTGTGQQTINGNDRPFSASNNGEPRTVKIKYNYSNYTLLPKSSTFSTNINEHTTANLQQQPQQQTQYEIGNKTDSLGSSASISSSSSSITQSLSDSPLTASPILSQTLPTKSTQLQIDQIKTEPSSSSSSLPSSSSLSFSSKRSHIKNVNALSLPNSFTFSSLLGSSSSTDQNETDLRIDSENSSLIDLSQNNQPNTSTQLNHSSNPSNEHQTISSSSSSNSKFDSELTNDESNSKDNLKSSTTTTATTPRSLLIENGSNSKPSGALSTSNSIKAKKRVSFNDNLLQVHLIPNVSNNFLNIEKYKYQLKTSHLATLTMNLKTDDDNEPFDDYIDRTTTEIENDINRTTNLIDECDLKITKNNEENETTNQLVKEEPKLVKQSSNTELRSNTTLIFVHSTNNDTISKNVLPSSKLYKSNTLKPLVENDQSESRKNVNTTSSTTSTSTSSTTSNNKPQNNNNNNLNNNSINNSSTSTNCQQQMSSSSSSSKQQEDKGYENNSSKDTITKSNSSSNIDSKVNNFYIGNSSTLPRSFQKKETIGNGGGANLRINSSSISSNTNTNTNSSNQNSTIYFSHRPYSSINPSTSFQSSNTNHSHHQLSGNKQQQQQQQQNVISSFQLPSQIQLQFNQTISTHRSNTTIPTTQQQQQSSVSVDDLYSKSYDYSPNNPIKPSKYNLRTISANLNRNSNDNLLRLSSDAKSLRTTNNGMNNEKLTKTELSSINENNINNNDDSTKTNNDSNAAQQQQQQQQQQQHSVTMSLELAPQLKFLSSLKKLKPTLQISHSFNDFKDQIKNDNIQTNEQSSQQNQQQQSLVNNNNNNQQQPQLTNKQNSFNNNNENLFNQTVVSNHLSNIVKQNSIKSNSTKYIFLKSDDKQNDFISGLTSHNNINNNNNNNSNNTNNAHHQITSFGRSYTSGSINLNHNTNGNCNSNVNLVNTSNFHSSSSPSVSSNNSETQLGVSKSGSEFCNNNNNNNNKHNNNNNMNAIYNSNSKSLAMSTVNQLVALKEVNYFIPNGTNKPFKKYHGSYLQPHHNSRIMTNMNTNNYHNGINGNGNILNSSSQKINGFNTTMNEITTIKLRPTTSNVYGETEMKRSHSAFPLLRNTLKTTNLHNTNNTSSINHHHHHHNQHQSFTNNPNDSSTSMLSTSCKIVNGNNGFNTLSYKIVNTPMIGGLTRAKTFIYNNNNNNGNGNIGQQQNGNSNSSFEKRIRGNSVDKTSL